MSVDIRSGCDGLVTPPWLAAARNFIGAEAIGPATLGLLADSGRRPGTILLGVPRQRDGACRPAGLVEFSDIWARLGNAGSDLMGISNIWSMENQIGPIGHTRPAFQPLTQMSDRFLSVDC